MLESVLEKEALCIALSIFEVEILKMKQSNSVPIETVGEFVQEVKKITNTFSGKGEENLFWFRGESNSDFKNPLTPGSYRDLVNYCELPGLKLNSKHVHNIERQIDADFFRRGHQYLREMNVENNLLNRYFIMQHYGIPTRLLDWSENALVALFFAVSSERTDSDGAVYILEPLILNNFTVHSIIKKEGSFTKIPMIVSDVKKENLLDEKGELRAAELYRRYLKMDFCNEISEKDVSENDISYYPLAIMPPALEKRMLVQSGCFTIFGNEIQGLVHNNNNNNNNKKEEFLRKIVIQKKSKKTILKELDQLGINENSIFSDLDGLGSYLKQKYSTRFQKNLKDFEVLFKKALEQR